MSDDYLFDGQRPDEKVEEVVRCHPVVLFWPGLKAVFLLVIPVAVLLFVGAGTLFSVATFVCLVLAVAVFSRAYYLYSNGLFLITSQRVIYLDQKTVMRKKITEAALSSIQDVSTDIGGLGGSVFGYGDLIIRTAGASEGSEIVVKNITDPYDIQQEITKRI